MTGVSFAKIELMSNEPIPGIRKICSVTNGAAKDSRHLERDQRHNRDQRVAQDVLYHDNVFGQTLRPRSGDIIETNNIEHRRSHITVPGRTLK
jgi:hypothetical protein